MQALDGNQSGWTALEMLNTKIEAQKARKAHLQYPSRSRSSSTGRAARHLMHSVGRGALLQGEGGSGMGGYERKKNKVSERPRAEV